MTKSGSRVAGAASRLWPVAAWLAVAVTAIVLAGSGSRASAHAFLVRTEPVAGARLERAPSELVLEFTEALTVRPVVAVRKIDSHQIGGLRPLVSDHPTSFRVGLPLLGRGVYVVSWAGDAEDGHRSEGTWAFAVGDVGGVSMPTPRQHQDPVSGAAIVFTWLSLLCLAAATAAPLIGPIAGSRRARFVSPAVGCVAVVFLVVRLAVVVGVGAALGLGHGPVTNVGALGVASVAFAAAAVLVRRGVVGVVLLTAAGASLIGGGHALGPGRWWVPAATVVHALLGLWWFASLIGVFVATAGDEAMFAGRVRAHARRAVVIVPVAVLAGLVTSLSRVGSIGALTASSYGRWSIAKATAVAAALVVAASARRRTRHIAPSESPLSRAGIGDSRWPTVLTVEMVLLVGAIGVGTVLASTPPPLTQRFVELGPSPLPDPTTTVAVLSGDHQLVATAARRRLQIRLVAPGNEAPLRSAVLNVSGVEPDGTIVTWQPRRCGPGCIEVDHHWQSGITALHVITAGSDGGNSTSQLHIEWPPVDASLAANVALQHFRTSRLVHVEETDSSGPLGTAAPYTFDLPGAAIIAQSPYPAQATKVTGVGDGHSGRHLRLWLPGSSTWIELKLDRTGRLTGDTIIDPGHLIKRRYTYP